MFLAVQGERRSSISEVAAAYGVSENHLMKITQRLASAGFIDALRGRNGGLRLGLPAEAINVGQVVRTFEPDFNLVECFGAGNTCPITPSCVLKKALADARRSFLAVLDSYTLAALATQPRRLQGHLGLPGANG
jgi:Rrf2 family nitric oxide-sensitive transcriptional repressor